MGVAYHCSLCFIANGRVSNCLPFCKYRLQSNFKKWQAVNQRRRKVVKVALNNARREPPQMSSPCLTNPKLQNSKKLLHLLMLIAMALLAVKICKIFILHWDAISKIPKKMKCWLKVPAQLTFKFSWECSEIKYLELIQRIQLNKISMF